MMLQTFVFVFLILLQTCMPYHFMLLGNKFEAEIRAEQEENRRNAEEAKIRKQKFKEKQAAFK